MGGAEATEEAADEASEATDEALGGGGVDARATSSAAGPLSASSPSAELDITPSLKPC